MPERDLNLYHRGIINADTFLTQELDVLP